MSTGLGHLSLPELEDADVEEFEDFEDDEDFELEADSADQDGPETESTDEPGENWEERFKGLQAENQRTVEGFNQLQTSYQQQQQQQAAVYQNFQQELFRRQIADLEPEQQQQAWTSFEMARRNQQAAVALQQREQQLAQMFQFVDEKGKEIAAQQIASRYQIPTTTLMKFDSPEEMMEAAKLAKSKRARRSSPSNQRKRSTRFEGGTAPGRRQKPKEKPKTLADAKAAFAALDVPGKR